MLEELPHLILCAPVRCPWTWPSGLAVVVRARYLLGKRSRSGRRSPVGPEGLVCLPPVRGVFLALDFGKRSPFPISLAENYNLAVTNRTAEAQEAHRDA